MSSKKKQLQTPTEVLLEEMKRVELRPIDVLHRAIILAELDGNYKEMMTGALGIMPYIAPRLKETQINAEVETTMNGMNGVNLNITVGGKNIVDAVVEEETKDDEENEEE